MQNEEGWECFYETRAASLEAETLSGLEAIRNVLLLAIKRNPESADLTHWPSWNLHYLREIDDADILAGCTDKCSGRAAIMVYDKGPDIAHPREVGNIKVQASDTIEECSER